MLLNKPDHKDAIKWRMNTAHIKTDLSTNWECEAVILEFLLQNLHKGLPHIVHLQMKLKDWIFHILPHQHWMHTKKKPYHQELICKIRHTLSYCSNSTRSSWLQFRPMGDTFNMPMRNSMKVPLSSQQPSTNVKPTRKHLKDVHLVTKDYNRMTTITTDWIPKLQLPDFCHCVITVQPGSYSSRKTLTQELYEF